MLMLPRPFALSLSKRTMSFDRLRTNGGYIFPKRCSSSSISCFLLLCFLSCHRMNNDIVVVGSINMDLVIRTPRMPLAGETLTGHDFHVIPGGKGANQAVAIARQGGRGMMVGCVGDDDFGRQQQHGLGEEGLDLSCLTVMSECATGIASITVDDTGQNCIIIVPGANAKLSPDHILAAQETIRQASMVVCQLEVPFETVRQTIELAHAHQTPVMLNPAPAPEQALSSELLEQITYLIPNEIEASRLSGIEVIDMASARQAATQLQARGCQTVLITLGSHGVMAAHAGEIVHFPAIQVQAIDTTAAGDVFVGSLAVALTEGKSLSDAVAFAQRAAAVSVMQLGAQSSIPTCEYVQEVLR
jgi:ribokinase